MVPTFFPNRTKRSFTSRFTGSVVVGLLLTGLSLEAMIVVITSRTLSMETKLCLLTLLMMSILPCWALIKWLHGKLL